MTAQLTWYVARSSGLLAWTLLTASVLWGLLLSTKILGRAPRPSWLLDLHRYLGGLATLFTVLHVVAIIVDGYVSFSVVDVLVPLASTWKPGPVAWGVVSLYLLLAVELTSLARHRLPRPLWRATHMASFPLFVMATVHGVTAGTDGRTWLYEALAVLGLMAVSGLVSVRLSTPTATMPRTIPATISDSMAAHDHASRLRSQ